MKPELLKTNQWSRWSRRTRHIDARKLRGRPDAEAPAFGPHSISQRQVEAIQLHAGMKVILEAQHDARSQQRLGPVRQYHDNGG
jgi:hypothetical protein